MALDLSFLLSGTPVARRLKLKRYISDFFYDPTSHKAKKIFLECTYLGIEVPPPIMEFFLDEICQQVKDAEGNGAVFLKISTMKNMSKAMRLQIIEHEIAEGERAGVVYKRYYHQLGYKSPDDVPSSSSVRKKINRMKKMFEKQKRSLSPYYDELFRLVPVTVGAVNKQSSEKKDSVSGEEAES